MLVSVSLQVRHALMQRRLPPDRFRHEKEGDIYHGARSGEPDLNSQLEILWTELWKIEI